MRYIRLDSRPDDRENDRRQSKVCHLNLAFGRKYYVLWLQITMNDVLVVCLLYCGRDLAPDIHYFLLGQRACMESGGECLAGDIFHNQVVDTVLRIEIVNSDDVRMA